MTSRHVQKLSSPGPRRSARPAMPRWNAWQCRLGRPGRAMPLTWWAASWCAASRGASGVTPVITPSSIATRTLRAQPPGRKAWSKNRIMVDRLPLSRYVYTIEEEASRRYDTIWLDARLATVDPARAGLGIVENGAIAAKDGRIAYVGPVSDLPAGWSAADTVRLEGRWVTPGLVDCHTHLVYGGNRAHEFEL